MWKHLPSLIGKIKEKEAKLSNHCQKPQWQWMLKQTTRENKLNFNKNYDLPDNLYTLTRWWVWKRPQRGRDDGDLMTGIIWL